MSLFVTALLALTDAGHVDDVFSPAEVAGACESRLYGPRHLDPHLCVRAVVAIWSVETRGQMPRFVRGTKYGCGPGQVLPRRRLWNSAFREVIVPPCETLQLNEVGLRWAADLFEMKYYRSRGRLKYAFFKYNTRSRSYAEKAYRMVKRWSR